MLFDILERHQEEFTARHLCVIGEHPLSARSISNQRVSGIADYVLGYEPHVRTLPRSFESFSIIVEAKKSYIDAGLGQIVAYMVAAQQHRVSLRPSRITNVVYGMVSDGIMWRFLRLDGKILHVSDYISAISNYGQRRVYFYIDRIIRANIESSPHTSPSKNFPATQELWRERVEANIFEDVTSTSQQTQNRPSGESAEASNPSDFEKYQIQRSGPDITVGSKYPTCTFI